MILHSMLETEDAPLGDLAVEKTVEFIREHFRENISFSDAARYAGISESHLRRCFKRKLGISFVDYLTAFRLDEAKRMMRCGHFTIAHISQQTGFSSTRYFCRVFKHATGQTPRDFMRAAALKEDAGEEQ